MITLCIVLSTIAIVLSVLSAQVSMHAMMRCKELKRPKVHKINGTLDLKNSLTFCDDNGKISDIYLFDAHNERSK